jgi:hypothetical protein
MPLPILNYSPMVSDTGLNGLKKATVHLIAQEYNVEMSLALVLAFKLFVRHPIQWEDNMTGGDEKELVAAPPSAMKKPLVPAQKGVAWAEMWRLRA